MLKLIPSPKYVEERIRKIEVKAVSNIPEGLSSRLTKAFEKLPFDKNGLFLTVEIGSGKGDAYELELLQNGIKITADCESGVYYAVKTLSQIFENECVFETIIKDSPDFEVRGVYYDVTRGKIPKLEELKRLVDTLAGLKTNMLFLYVEHVFAFRETKEIVKRTGEITEEELRELDSYCEENFVELVPSIATFGHMGEILDQEQYAHLRCNQEPVVNPNTLQNRALTIDPRKEESFELVKSLISQYAPIFKSDKFHICCDETMDLKYISRSKEEEGELFFAFAEKICRFVNSIGKTVIMWSDIVRDYPDRLRTFPKNVIMANWLYSHVVGDDLVKLVYDVGATQYVAPSTCSYGRFSENLDFSVGNIINIADYGYRWGAKGFVNTNWGDCGNPNTWELSMYSFALGAQKAWNVRLHNGFNDAMNLLIYKHPRGVERLILLNELHRPLGWFAFVNAAHKFYYEVIKKEGSGINGYFGQGTCDELYGFNEEVLCYIQGAYSEYIKTFPEDFVGEYADEMLIAAEGVCVMAELFAKMMGKECRRLTDTGAWLEKFNAKWNQKNKPVWCDKINNVFNWIEDAKL